MAAMMGQPKPAATLSSALLARKGQARPAMRPQGFSGFGAVSESLDDLGWNDMGHNAMQPGPAPAATSVELPPVLRQREVLKEEIEAPTLDVHEPAPHARGEEHEAVTCPVLPVATRNRLPAQPQDAGAHTQQIKSARAAFTLRLDSDRHLRLRLASAISHRSSQQLVTEALDNFLQSVPEVEELADRLSPRLHSKFGDGG